MALNWKERRLMATKSKKRSTATKVKNTKGKKPKMAKMVTRSKAKPAKPIAAKKKSIAKKGAKMAVKKSSAKSTKKSEKKVTKAKSGKTVAKKKVSPKAIVSKTAKKAVAPKKSQVKAKAVKMAKTKQKKPVAPKITKAAKSTPSKNAKPKKLAIVEFSGKKVAVQKKKQLAPLKTILPGEEQISGLQVSSLVGMDIPPYQETPGEEYMNERQQEHFRKILFKWKDQLLEEMDRTMHHLQDEAANFPDPNDRATQEEEFSLELRARDRERKLIKKIEETLQKIDVSEYGYCDSCGVEIGIRRLEARPTANLCIDCKTLDEIRERQLWG